MWVTCFAEASRQARMVGCYRQRMRQYAGMLAMLSQCTITSASCAHKTVSLVFCICKVASFMPLVLI
jgi:hypothetical protein